VIDKRFVGRGSYNVHHSGSSYQVWEFMVEIAEAGGEPVRLLIKDEMRRLTSAATRVQTPEVLARVCEDIFTQRHEHQQGLHRHENPRRSGICRDGEGRNRTGDTTIFSPEKVC
jgi:hypothetical protein